jgi:hypothetical protein
MDYKIEVHSKAESMLVQEHAFKLGARADLATYVKNGNGRFLYLRDGRITFDDRESDFKKSLCEQISVDDFIELTTLEDKIENSRGDWIVWITKVHDHCHVVQTQVERCRRFDTEQQAKEALNDVNKVLNTRQVANALGLDITLAYKSIQGENDKNIDRFKAEMKRRGF